MSRKIDEDHLRKLADKLGVKRIGVYKDNRFENSNIARMTASCENFVTDLKKNWNIVRNKTLTLEPPELDEENSLAYIAGYMDGDGCYSFSENRPALSTLGTKPVMLWMVDKLDIEPKLSLNHKSNELTWGWSIQGDKAIRARGKYINLDIPFLNRKYKRWEKLGLDMEIKRG